MALWKTKTMLNKKTTISPGLIIFSEESSSEAQAPTLFKEPSETISRNERGSNERSGKKRGGKKRGSITIEAALALPIFILFVAAFISLFPFLQSQIEKQYEMDAAAGKAAVYMHVLANAQDYEASALDDIDLSLFGNGVSVEDDEVTISLTSYKKISFLPGKLGRLFVTHEICRRAWTGRIIEDEDGTAEDDEYVYVAENGSVYHTTESCSHLKLNIKEVTMEELSYERNTSGHIYYACEKCCSGKSVSSGTIYIGPDGVRYHTDRECSGLKRTYTKVKKSETTLPACSRCGG